MSDHSKTEILDAAAHWERLADEKEAKARWDQNMGLIAGPVESSPGYNAASTFRDCAASLRMEAETGLPHCACHLRPRRAAHGPGAQVSR